MKKIIVTTSWDDGYKLDLKLLNLLNKYNLKGTFYIPQKINYLIAKDKPLIQVNQEQIQEIAQSQEIGAHTLNHIYLNQLSLIESEKEIKLSKDWLEELIGQQIKMFSYPGGILNDEIVEIVKKSGFLGARTSQQFQLDLKNAFLMGTSLQCYPYFVDNKEWSMPFRIKMSSKCFFSNLREIFNLELPLSSVFGWVRLSENFFDYICQKGGIYHLWGHSWEIERYGLWEDLEKIFKYIANKENILYLTNSQTIYENFISTR